MFYVQKISLSMLFGSVFVKSMVFDLSDRFLVL